MITPTSCPRGPLEGGGQLDDGLGPEGVVHLGRLIVILAMPSAVSYRTSV
jgi:hypothetical protein